MLTELSKVPSEQKKRDFFPAKNPVDVRREVVPKLEEEERADSILKKLNKAARVEKGVC